LDIGGILLEELEVRCRALRGLAAFSLGRHVEGSKHAGDVTAQQEFDAVAEPSGGGEALALADKQRQREPLVEREGVARAPIVLKEISVVVGSLVCGVHWTFPFGLSLRVIG
jgi:hypothetical protein